MRAYLELLVTRTAEAIAAFVVISLAIFSLATLVPGDIVSRLSGTEGVTAERAAALRAQLGLDEPFFERYFDWLMHAAQGDFGVSLLTQRSITEDIMNAFPVSLQVTVLSLVISIAIGVPIGIYAATHQGSRVDKVLRGSALILLSVPSFVMAIALIWLTSRYLPELYSSFYISPVEALVPGLRSLMLPSISVACGLVAMVAQMTRSSMLEALAQPYITTAMAKGVTSWRIRTVHALRSALAPVVTLVGLLFGTLIGGLIIVESVFNLPGLGAALTDAIKGRDYPFVIAGTILIVAIYMLVNLVIDLLYPVLDPRMRRR